MNSDFEKYGGDMKKFISVILSLAMLLPVIAIPSAALESSVNTSSHNIDKYILNFQQDGNIRSVIVSSYDGKTVDAVCINDETGIVTINGSRVSRLENIPHIQQRPTSMLSKGNWTQPQTSVQSLSFVSFASGAIVGYLALKYGVPDDKAAYIASLVIGAGGFLYVKSVTQFNYIDYSPKDGYRLPESLHLTEDANGGSLFSRTVSGTR